MLVTKARGCVALVVVIGVPLLLGLVFPEVSPAPPTRIDVTDSPYNATPDSSPVDDDRSAFVDALADCVEQGLPLYVPSGTYDFPNTPYRVQIPDGVDVIGDGIGDTIINGYFICGSHVTIGGQYGVTYEYRGMTWGKNNGAGSKKPFTFSDGAHEVVIGDCRFRGGGPSGMQWCLSDYVGSSSWYWNETSNPPASAHLSDVHDVTFERCEFEHPGDDKKIMDFCPDSRAGGAQPYDVEFVDCTFGCKDYSGDYSGAAYHILIQQGPFEHAVDGPTPSGANPIVDSDYWIDDDPFDEGDWSVIDHGGFGAASGADFGLRFDGCVSVGTVTGTVDAIDIADLYQSYLYSYMPYGWYDDSTDPGTYGSSAQQSNILGARPETCFGSASVPVTMTDCIVQDGYRIELPSAAKYTSGNVDGDDGWSYTYATAVPSIVQTHDDQLY